MDVLSTMGGTTVPNAGDQVALNQLFRKAVGKYDKLEESNSSTSEATYQSELSQSIDMFLQAGNLTRALGLFSINETLEDIGSAELRYLLCEAYAADLMLKMNTTRGPVERLNLLRSVEGLLLMFVDNCELHGILTPDEKQDWSFLKDSTEADAAQRQAKYRERDRKIARFKHEKSLKEKLKVLRARAAADAKKGSGEENYDNLDDEVVRELHLTLLHFFVTKTFENLSMVLQEKNMLKEAVKVMEENGGVMPPPEVPPASEAKKPYTIHCTRDWIQKNVFKPGWNQPTMDMDEYLQYEVATGKIPAEALDGSWKQQNEARMREIAKNPDVHYRPGGRFRVAEMGQVGNPYATVKPGMHDEDMPESEDETDAQADEQTYKLRAQDEHSDYVKRGSGNTYNRS